MAKTRMIKHDLRTSEKVASWPFEIRYFWVLLWGYVDDHGKGKDNPLLVKSDCLPLDPDVTAEQVDGWLWHLEAAGVIVRYTVEMTQYLAIVNWPEHQKPPHPTKDVLPAATDPRAVRRELHASRMNNAGEPSEDFTHELGWVESGFGSEVEKSAHLPAGVTFDDFWNIWPRKDKRKDAETAWNSAKRRAAPEVIVRVAAEYAAHPYRPAKQFVPYGATWLRGDCWKDPMPEAPEAIRRVGKQTPTERAMTTLSLATDIEMAGIES